MEHCADVSTKREIPRIVINGNLNEAESQPFSHNSNPILWFDRTLKHREQHLSPHFDQLCDTLNTQSCVSDVKLLMFAAAVNSEGYRSTLMPMPPLYLGDSYYDIERLRQLVALWPSCRQMLDNLQSSTSPQGHIQLLHWLLISQANPALRRHKVSRLKGLCKDCRLQLSTTHLPQELLSVSYKDGQLATKPISRPRRCRHFAFLGCPLPLIYRLLLMGRMDNNWTGPMRLYDRLDAALAQCTISVLPLPARCWSHSRFGRAPRCVLLCELLPDKLTTRQQQQLEPPMELIIEDISCFRVHYLLLFTERHESVDLPVAVSICSNISARREMSASFQSRSQSSSEFRGGCGNSWIYRGFRWLLIRVGHVLQQQQRTF